MGEERCLVSRLERDFSCYLFLSRLYDFYGWNFHDPFCRLPGKTTLNVSDWAGLKYLRVCNCVSTWVTMGSVLKLILRGVCRSFGKTATWKWSSSLGSSANDLPASGNLHLRIRIFDDHNRRNRVTQSSFDCKPSVVTEKNTQRADAVSVCLWNRCRQWKEGKKTFFIAFRRYISRSKES